MKILIIPAVRFKNFSRDQWNQNLSKKNFFKLTLLTSHVNKKEEKLPQGRKGNFFFTLSQTKKSQHLYSSEWNLSGVRVNNLIGPAFINEIKCIKTFFIINILKFTRKPEWKVFSLSHCKTHKWKWNRNFYDKTLLGKRLRRRKVGRSMFDFKLFF